MQDQLFNIFRSLSARLVAVGVVSSVATNALAHDFVILPSQFSASRGTPLNVDLTIAGKFPKLEIAVPADRIKEISVVESPKMGFEIVGAGPQSLITRFVGNAPGLAVLSARLRPAEVNYAEAKIAGILEEYQMASETVALVEALPRPRTLKVLSSRFAKSFVCVERCDGGADPTKPIGHNLEFVAADMKARVFVLHANGAPLPDYPVVVAEPDGTRHHAKTSAAGAVTVKAGLTGPAMLFAAVMRPPSGTSERFVLDLASLTLPNQGWSK
jgi:hypothetical protein